MKSRLQRWPWAEVLSLAGSAVFIVTLVAPAISAQTGGGVLPGASARPQPEVRLSPVNIRLIQDGLRMPIDLPTALALAGARNLDALEAKARLAEAEAEKEHAIGALLPGAYSSFLMFGQNTSGQTQGFFTDFGRSFDRLNVAGGTELSLNPAKAIFDALAAHRIVGAAVNDDAEATQEALAEAAIGYFDLQRARAAVKIAQQAVAASQELEHVAGDRESLGAGLKVDVLRARARVAGDKIRLSQTGQAMREASVKLALILKLDPKVTLFPLDIAVFQRTLVDPQMSLNSVIARALSAHPLLKAQAERIQAAGDYRSAAWSTVLAPSIYTNIQENSIADTPNNPFYVGSVGLRFSFASLGDAKAAAARLEQARIERQKAEQAIAARLFLARDQVATASEQVEAAVSGLEAAQAAFDLTQTRYKGGVGIELDTLEAEATLVESRISLVAAIVGYNIAQVRLLQAFGDVSAASLVK